MWRHSWSTVCFIIDYTDRDTAIAGLIDQLFYRSRLYSCFWRGEEAAWTKINGSGVHAHTDTYLCIVARSHFVNSHKLCHTFSHSRDDAGCRLSFCVSRYTEAKFVVENQGLIRYTFSAIVCFRNVPHKYIYTTARNTACGEWSPQWRDKFS